MTTETKTNDQNDKICLPSPQSFDFDTVPTLNSAQRHTLTKRRGAHLHNGITNVLARNKG